MNYNLYNRELQDGYILKKIELYKAAAAYAPTIIKVFEAFNNKCFNCKLEKALQDATGRRVYAEKRYNNINIYFYENGDSYTLASIKIDDLINGKRIPANKLIEDARSRQQGYYKKAYELQQGYENIDNIITQLNQVKSLLNGILNPIPYEIKDVYRINYHL